MKRYTLGRFELGAQLTVIFALLVAFILGGNSLLIWQFRIARQQTIHLAVVSRQMVAVLRLQYSLASFHKGLDTLVASADARALRTGSERLQLDLLEQVRQTRAALSLSPSTNEVDKRFLPILDGVEMGFPYQLSAICALAGKDDWDAVKERAARQLAPTESEVARIVQDSDAAFADELARTEQDSLRLQDRILFLIPFLALSTFLMAALFVWVIAQKILEVKLEERLNERMRITRDLHDTFLQTIQGSKLYAEHALAKSADLQSTREAMGQLVRWLERATDEGRSALNSLRSTEDDQYDLGDALQAITVDARAQSSMKVVLSVSGSPIDLLPEVQEQVLRIAGEAIANACKHSQGSQTDVKLEYAGHILLTVSDDGRGFHPTGNEDAAMGKYGLRTMRERAVQVGGKLTITSSPGSGTQVTLFIPRRSLRAWPAKT